MNIFKLVLFTFISAVMCASALAGNAIYKWTDKDGGVHYSQTAPKGQQVQVMSTKTPQSDETTDSDENNEQDTDDANAETEESETDLDEEGDDKKKTDIPVATKDQATCDKALQAIQDLQNNPIVTVNGKVMTIEEKNAQLQTMDEIVKVHCP